MSDIWDISQKKEKRTCSTLIYMNNGTRIAQREITTLVIDTSSGN